MKSILATLRDSGSFDVFLDLVRAAGMEERFESDGPYTLFAPDDDVFREIPRPELEAILRNADRLGDTLNYHTVPGVHSMIDLLGIGTLRSLQGDDLTVEIVPEGVLINGAAVVESDAWCTNGICHAVSALLLPPPVARTVAVHG
jgi:uncharacterized surface protein with fasciclin (FAS1) repeats